MGRVYGTPKTTSSASVKSTAVGINNLDSDLTSRISNVGTVDSTELATALANIGGSGSTMSSALMFLLSNYKTSSGSGTDNDSKVTYAGHVVESNYNYNQWLIPINKYSGYNYIHLVAGSVVVPYTGTLSSLGNSSVDIPLPERSELYTVAHVFQPYQLRTTDWYDYRRVTEYTDGTHPNPNIWAYDYRINIPYAYADTNASSEWEGITVYMGYYGADPVGLYYSNQNGGFNGILADFYDAAFVSDEIAEQILNPEGDDE